MGKKNQDVWVLINRLINVGEEDEAAALAKREALTGGVRWDRGGLPYRVLLRLHHFLVVRQAYNVALEAPETVSGDCVGNDFTKEVP